MPPISFQNCCYLKKNPTALEVKHALHDLGRVEHAARIDVAPETELLFRDQFEKFGNFGLKMVTLTWRGSSCRNRTSAPYHRPLRHRRLLELLRKTRPCFCLRTPLKKFTRIVLRMSQKNWREKLCSSQVEAGQVRKSAIA